jgi:hypothetical protein
LEKIIFTLVNIKCCRSSEPSTWPSNAKQYDNWEAKGNHSKLPNFSFFIFFVWQNDFLPLYFKLGFMIDTMLVHGHGPQSIIAIMLEMDLTTLKSLSINMDDVQRRLAQHDFEPPNNPHSDSMAKIQVVAVSGCS